MDASDIEVSDMAAMMGFSNFTGDADKKPTHGSKKPRLNQCKYCKLISRKAGSLCLHSVYFGQVHVMVQFSYWIEVGLVKWTKHSSLRTDYAVGRLHEYNDGRRGSRD